MGGQREVVQDATEGQRRPVDEVEVGLGARVELRPDLAPDAIEVGETSLDGGAVKEGGVGQQVHPHPTETIPIAHCADSPDGFGEDVARGGLSVPGEGDVVDPAKFGARGVEGWDLPEGARLDQAEQPVQFRRQAGEIDGPCATGLGSIDLAVGTIEIARLVRVQVDANGQSFRSSRYDRIDVAVGVQRAAVVLKVKGVLIGRHDRGITATREIVR